MGRQQRRQLFLLAAFALVAAGGVAAAWFGVHLADERERAQGERDAAVFGVGAERVTRIEVTAAGLTTTLTRVGDEFRILEPVPLETDRAAVEALLATATSLTRRRRIDAVEDEDELVALGLASPQARIALHLDDGTTRALLLGNENAFDDSVFALVEGERAPFSIERASAHLLALKPFGLRDRRVLPFEPARARGVQLELEGALYAMVREGAGEWRITAPRPDRADPKVAAKLVERLSKLEGAEAVAELTDPTLHLTGADRGAITIALEDGSLLRLETAKQAEIGLLARDPTKTTLWRLDEKLLAADVPKLEALVDKALLASAGEEVERIVFEPRGSSPFAVEREPAAAGEAGWRLGSPGGPPALAHKVTFALTTLVTLVVDEWTDAPPERLASLGLSPPARTVRLFAARGAPLEVIHVGAPDARGELWIRIEGSPKAGRVAARRLAELPATPAELLPAR